MTVATPPACPRREPAASELPEPYHDDGNGVVLYHADCRDLMAAMAAESVDAVVTDPPAGINFMQKEFDSDRGGRDNWIAWLTGILRECYRVAKPGAHAVVWALPRTSGWTHRALEDAGWEVRDCVVHLFGSGFPKSANVSKMLDKMAGMEREVVGPDRGRLIGGNGGASTNHGRGGVRYGTDAETAPATDLASQWDGWGTALKPAAEFWYLARKPLIGTVAQTVARFGTGALNVDGCRISAEPGRDMHGNRGIVGNNFGAGLNGGTVLHGKTDLGRWPPNVCLTHSPGCREVGVRRVKSSADGGPGRQSREQWRYPGGKGHADPDGFEMVSAWECAEGCPVAELDRQSGERTSLGGSRGAGGQHGRYSPIPGQPDFKPGYGDTGGASRFFLNVAPDDDEATVWECAEGCPVAMLDRQSGERKSSGGRISGDETSVPGYGGGLGRTGFDGYGDTGGASRFFLNVAPDDEATRFLYCGKSSRRERNAGLEGMPERVLQATDGNVHGAMALWGDNRDPNTGAHKPQSNHHPTVKPIALMRWLVRLVTPPGGVVLDPFLGSGTTLAACALEGFGGIGIDSDVEYLDIARRRIAHWVKQGQPQSPPTRRAAKPKPPADDAEGRTQLGFPLAVRRLEQSVLPLFHTPTDPMTLEVADR